MTFSAFGVTSADAVCFAFILTQGTTASSRAYCNYKFFSGRKAQVLTYLSTNKAEKNEDD
jgi:hypothetical protein